MLEYLIAIDRGAFLWVNGWGNTFPFLDPVMLLVSSKWAAIPLYVWLAYLILKVYGPKHLIYIGICATVLIVMTDQGSVHLFKDVFQRLRPCHDESLQGLVRLVKANCGGLYGFVSSHASNTFGFTVFSITLLGPYYRKLPSILMLWATIVGISRVYLGLHFPGDVVFGALFGMMVGRAVGAGMFHLVKLRP